MKFLIKYLNKLFNCKVVVIMVESVDFVVNYKLV